MITTNLKKLDSIQDFISAWKRYDLTQSHVPNWTLRFREAGYYGIEYRGSELADAIDWCTENFQSRFSWAGRPLTFWFEDEKDAVLFALRWS